MVETITIDDYTTLQLSEYNGTYSLVEGYIGKDGNFYPKTCMRVFKKDTPEKKAPVSIKCGEKEHIIGLAYWILEQFEKDKMQQQERQPGDDDF